MSGTGNDKIQALIDDLEKSIASFDERFSNLPVDDAPPPYTPADPQRIYPAIDPSARRDLPAATAHAKPSEPTESAQTPLLSELAASASSEAAHVRTELARREDASRAIDRALRFAYDYLQQLTTHLNLLKPALPLLFAIDRQHAFADVHWQDSSTRTEKNSRSELAQMEKLALRIRLTCQPPTLIVQDGQLRRLENELYLMNIAWRDAGIVDLPGRGIGHRIEVDGSVPLQLVFTADPDQRRIILRCRNLLGLGLSAYAIAPETIDADTMDMLGRCLLGRSKKLPDSFQPIAFNSPDSTA